MFVKNKHYKNLINIITLFSTTRAVQLIECDCHEHLISKTGSVIGGKSPSPAFRWSGS